MLRNMLGTTAAVTDIVDVTLMRARFAVIAFCLGRP